jgi:hypothetical protein
MASFTVHTNAIPGSPTFGDTDIIVFETDPDREAFLKHCADWCHSHNRPEDAKRFMDAIPQTPST